MERKEERGASVYSHEILLSENPSLLLPSHSPLTCYISHPCHRRRQSHTWTCAKRRVFYALPKRLCLPCITSLPTHYSMHQNTTVDWLTGGVPEDRRNRENGWAVFKKNIPPHTKKKKKNIRRSAPLPDDLRRLTSYSTLPKMMMPSFCKRALAENRSSYFYNINWRALMTWRRCAPSDGGDQGMDICHGELQRSLLLPGGEIFRRKNVGGKDFRKSKLRPHSVQENKRCDGRLEWIAKAEWV